MRWKFFVEGFKNQISFAISKYCKSVTQYWLPFCGRKFIIKFYAAFIKLECFLLLKCWNPLQEACSEFQIPPRAYKVVPKAVWDHENWSEADYVCTVFVHLIKSINEREVSRNKDYEDSDAGSDSAPACYGSFLGSNPDIPQKYKMGDIRKEVANTFYPAKKLYKKRS